MFKAIIESEKLKETIESVSSIVDEAKLNLTPEGLTIRAVDPANVAMVSMTMKSSAFEEFTATDGELGVDLNRLNDIMSMAEKAETVELELDEESHKLVIRMSGLTYKIALLDPASIRKEPKIPQLELPASIILSGSDMKRAVKAAEKVSDHISMGVDGETFYLEAEGDSDRMRLDMLKDQLIGMKSGDAHSLFSLDYLSDMIKSAGKANEITLELGKDFPVKINFKIAGGSGDVNYLLAPRIESD
ncbi:MAG: DNA polymerase sliding clamp [Methanosarcinales archaeon]|nr:DNA polymerase sliding clamp [Methanosarcinales archaeon]